MALNLPTQKLLPMENPSLGWQTGSTANSFQGWRKLASPAGPLKQLPVPSHHSKQHRTTCSASRRKKNINSCSSKRTASVRQLLAAFDDEYGGVIVDPQSLPSSVRVFAAALGSSLHHWKLKGKRGIWLKIPEEKADLVPIAIREGFSFHHAELGYVMMTAWIPDYEPCLLPLTATHQVGIGAFVMNEDEQVLVVKEKRGPSRCSGIWKLPTGFIHKSEEIFTGAVREVKEETGIDTTFTEVLAFRHAHNVTFDKSDLMFLCMLRPISFDITIDEFEIEAAKWISLNEFKSEQYSNKDNMWKNMLEICIGGQKNCYHGFETHLVMSNFDDRLTFLYHGRLETSIGNNNKEMVQVEGMM